MIPSATCQAAFPKTLVLGHARGELGLKEIAKVRGLESLNLSSTNITHVGLEY